MKTSKLFMLVFIIFLSGQSMATERPKYRVLLVDGAFELREYPPMLLAQTILTANKTPSSNKAFKVLADYIFGNNTVAKITSPEASSVSAKIAMTAPVLSEKSDNTMQMAFVMPVQYTKQTIPKPNTSAVSLVQMPKTKMAVITFSGLSGDEKVAKKTQQLQAWMQLKELTPSGPPKLARYDAPWVLPLLRENEIWIQYTQ